MDVSAALFIAVALGLMAATVLLVIHTGFARLNSIIGIMGDGLPMGQLVPSWKLPDVHGILHQTPALDRWQFLIFIDKSLGGYPLLISGMHILSAETELEVLQLSRDSKAFCAAMACGLDLRIPVISVPSTLYDQYRVRIMPFAFLLDPAGHVHWRGLVNSGEQMKHLWRLVREVDPQVAAARR